jgi:hypothetical protein
MRTIATGILLIGLAAEPAIPLGPSAGATTLACNEDCLHWSDRSDPADARLAITTEDGKVMLLLTDRDVVFQLSNRTLHRVRRELRDAKDEQDNWLASAIVTAVTGTVCELLDHSFVCGVRDIRDVSYQDGRLVFIGRHGRPMFHDARCSDTDVMGAFSDRDARAFVREFRRLKAAR